MDYNNTKKNRKRTDIQMQDDDLSGLLPTMELTTETYGVDKCHRLPGEAAPSIRLVNPIYIYLY